MITAVFFDLDGTLIDTADDLAEALNHVRGKRGLPPLPSAVLRPYASRGAGGLLQVGLGLTAADSDFEAARNAFLAHYGRHLTEHVRFFPGIETLLASFETEGMPWGIITNKHERFTAPLLKYLGLDQRAACAVSGDTTEHAKPHPLPLLHAAAQIHVEPQQCWYVGDDRRDIDAARAAGFQRAVAVRWGYLGDSPVESWGADVIIDTPEELRSMLAAAQRTNGRE